MRGDNQFNQVLKSLLTSKFDTNPTTNEEYAEQLLSIHAHFVKRNGKLTDLLEDYIIQRRDRVKTNNVLKLIIFWFFIILLGILTIAVAISMICYRANTSASSAVSLISVAITYLASLIAVFEIISKYLFPIDEEKDAINMIQAVITNDVQVEELMSTVITKSHSEAFERLKLLKQLCDEKVLTEKEFNEIKKKLIKKIEDK
ncbi:MAG: hypothetical protein E7616_05590 [Ruminococcaceae bacterium]|nr:hypothetical protein [Oscillospiraceae bacterium]